MRVMIGLAVATGLPWEYWGRQDDDVVATALDILARANGKGRAEPSQAHERAPMMSG